LSTPTHKNLSSKEITKFESPSERDTFYTEPSFPISKIEPLCLFGEKGINQERKDFLVLSSFCVSLNSWEESIDEIEEI